MIASLTVTRPPPHPHPQVDLLPEIASPPRFVPAPEQLLPPQLQAEVDSYLAQRGPPAFLMGLRSRLTLSPSDALVCGERQLGVEVVWRAAVLFLGCACAWWWARMAAGVALLGSAPLCSAPNMP